jgi:threonine dehydrogenase-like Zn-dependent dehydrogenase
MQAAVFYGGKDIRVEEVPTPVPGPGEALIAVRAAGICGSDLHYYRGEDPWKSAAQGPRRSGHELAGVITELGPGVEGLSVGQRVAIEPLHLLGCGKCQQCLRGDYHICRAREMKQFPRRASAGFAEFDLAVAENIFSLPDSVSFEAASLIDVYACGVHAINRLEAHTSDAIAIIGTGPVGLTLGQVARSQGIRNIIMIGRRDELLNAAIKIGAADLAINSKKTADVARAVRGLTGGEGPGLVFDTVGGEGDALKQALDVVSFGGVIAVMGAFRDDVSIPYYKANSKEIRLLLCNSYSSWRGAREYKVALDLVASGRVQAERLITHRYRLCDIACAFAAAADKGDSGAIKVIVQPQNKIDSSL